MAFLAVHPERLRLVQISGAGKSFTTPTGPFQSSLSPEKSVLCFLLGVLCVLCLCGVYIRHRMPPLHPRPMAVFRCQHLRVGPVCVAHRLVQVSEASGFYSFYPT